MAMLLVLFVQPLYAEANTGNEDSAGALHFVDGKGQWQEPALVLGSDFDVRVSGLIADSKLVRSFKNTSDDWREGVFVFPLPEKASVYGLTMKVGRRTIVGEVQPRAEAKKTYEAARDAGRHAATVEQQRPNLFTTRVANIPPGAEVSVELSYQQLVSYRDGVFELSVPTTLTPRYMPGEPLVVAPQQWQGGWAVPTTEVADADAISPFTVDVADVAADSHRASVRLTVDAGLPLARVFSPSHEVAARQDGQVVSVAPRAGNIVMNRDFVLRWQPIAGQEPGAAVFHQQWEGEDYLLAMVMPGRAGKTRLPRNLTFVIDTSGSMAGESIRQAREALQLGLETLAPGDRFNVIQFNSQPHALFMRPEMATANNLARARQYVSGLTADGGTEMAPALTLALEGQGENTGELQEESTRVRQVVFITDGAVGNESALFSQIRRQLGDQRLFTVAIGSAPNRHFMREAARWGRGSYTSVQDPADISGPLARLFAAMEAPVLTDIQVNWPGQSEAAMEDSFPLRPGDLFQGEPLLQVVRGVSPTGELSVSGQLPGGGKWQQNLDLQQAAPGTGLNRYWAREKIDSLLDEARIQAKEPAKTQITELAVKHSLMSPFTSFVAVDKTPARAAETRLVRDHLPTLLPAGSQPGLARYPQTATFAPLLIALGFFGLMLGAAMMLLQRRAYP
ncbi:marine proteobacterial sortase target protein [Streptosporangium jomthongense]|uniref:Marine proteobacterial sortase target protein n=1 Tax=Marinobacter aromaticivorans TaxID=1494078 RepID=A0ABW2ITT6_9GAMM|nr:marine proteobacterial sortase target protein [Marinobacter aromaticivorans]GGE61915.1 marine proteobacterial sortase target protein [Streptosporangium jomthongense]